MNNLVPAGSSISPGTTLPVAIDYPAALALRQMAIVHDELPRYLLAPPYPFVQLATLKLRAEKAARTAGRAPAGNEHGSLTAAN